LKSKKAGKIEDEMRGFETGCIDYIIKPFSPAIVMARVKTHLKLKDALETMASQNKKLEREKNKVTQNNSTCAGSNYLQSINNTNVID